VRDDRLAPGTASALSAGEGRTAGISPSLSQDVIMRHHAKSALALFTAASLAAACGGGSRDAAANNAANMPASNTPAATSTTTQTSAGAVDTMATPQHHSKLKGAVLGGAAGALIGGKRGALAGAAIGAAAQHHRNKVEGGH
jgi:hypothetical protein